MNIDPQLKRAFIVAPTAPTVVIGAGTVQWTNIDGDYFIKMDNTLVAEQFPADMVLLWEDL